MSNKSVTTFIPGRLYSDKPLPNPMATVLRYVKGDWGGPHFTFHSGFGMLYIEDEEGLIGFLPGEDFYPVDEEGLVGGE